MEWNSQMRISKEEFDEIQIMETKLTEEFHKIHTYEEFKKFRNKYKNYIFIDYFMWDPIKI